MGIPKMLLAFSRVVFWAEGSSGLVNADEHPVKVRANRITVTIAVRLIANFFTLFSYFDAKLSGIGYDVTLAVDKRNLGFARF